jgi:hypothetical protein
VDIVAAVLKGKEGHVGMPGSVGHLWTRSVTKVIIFSLIQHLRSSQRINIVRAVLEH